MDVVDPKEEAVLALQADFDHAQETANIDPNEAIATYRKIIFKTGADDARKLVVYLPVTWGRGVRDDTESQLLIIYFPEPLFFSP